MDTWGMQVAKLKVLVYYTHRGAKGVTITPLWVQW